MADNSKTVPTPPIIVVDLRTVGLEICYMTDLNALFQCYSAANLLAFLMQLSYSL